MAGWRSKQQAEELVRLVTKADALASMLGVKQLTKEAAEACLKEVREEEEAAERARIAAIPPVDRTQRVLTDGSPVPEDNSHTELKHDGQQRGYVVLTDEERAKGFVEPVRHAYIHVGIPAAKHPLRDLTPEEKTRYGDAYVKFEVYPAGSRSGGRFWTQEDLDRVNKGCGYRTSMGRALAETYARDPHFYSGTFCAHCGAHFDVGEDGEFVWEGTDQRVGTTSQR